MRLAAASERIHGAGAEVIAISVDDDDHQAGMSERWPTDHVLYVSDPGGERFLQRLDLFDPEDRGGVALPGLMVIAPDGEEVYRYAGRDFADRTTDDDALAALDELGLDAVEPPPGGPDRPVPEDLRGYFRPTDARAYFLGNKFAAVAIGGRTEDGDGRSLAREHRLMADATLEAWDQVRPRS